LCDAVERDTRTGKTVPPHRGGLGGIPEPAALDPLLFVTRDETDRGAIVYVENIDCVPIMRGGPDRALGLRGEQRVFDCDMACGLCENLGCDALPAVIAPSVEPK
jgi:hypothetical protein